MATIPIAEYYSECAYNNRIVKQSIVLHAYLAGVTVYSKNPSKVAYDLDLDIL